MQINLAEGVEIDAQKVMTGRCCIIGQSGSGKSFLVGIFAEELCKIKLPFVLIDTEGEYTNIGKAFNLMVLGNGPESNVSFGVDYKELFRQSIAASKAVIMDVSDLIEPQEEVYKAISALYMLEEELRKPYLIIIEEADKFVPQVVHRGVNIIEEVSVRGRKRGIGLMVATQRPANISKNVLAQCSYGFIGRLTIENDFDAIGILIENRKRMEEVARLGVGEFVPFGISRDEKFKAKSRSILHSGSTPTLTYGSAGDIDFEAILNSFRNKSAYPKTEKKISAKEPARRLKLIKARHSIEELRAKLENLTKPGILGIKAYDSIDSLSEILLPFIHAKLLIPRKKQSEYKEADIILDKNLRPVIFSEGIKYYDRRAPKNLKLSQEDKNILHELRRLNKSDTEKISKLLGLDLEVAERRLITLEEKSLITVDGNKYKIKKIESTNQKAPELEDAEVKSEALRFPDEKSISHEVDYEWPGCNIESFSEFYVPVYKAVLRKGRKLRVSIFNSMDLKESKELSELL